MKNKIINYYFKTIICLVFISIISCKWNNLSKNKLENNLSINKKEAGDKGINGKLLSSLEKVENYYLIGLNKRIKFLEKRFNKLTNDEKKELASKKLEIKKLKIRKEKVKKCFQKLNSSKQKNNKNLKINAINFLTTFCKELKNIKSKNSNSKQLNLPSIKNSKNTEEYLNKIINLKTIDQLQNSKDNTSWEDFIKVCITENMHNVFDAAKQTIKKNKKGNIDKNFQKNIDDTINASKQMITAYLNIAKTKEMKSKILSSISKKKNKTKFINTIDQALKLFENEIIKPIKSGYIAIKNSSEFSDSEKGNAKKSYNLIFGKFLYYKKEFEKYKKNDPKGEAMKKIIESLFKENNVNFDIAESVFSTIIFITELKNLLTIIIEESKNSITAKDMSDKMIYNDLKWKEGIENMSKYIKSLKKIGQLKKYISKIKLKIKNIIDREKYNQIESLLKLSEKEFELILTFLEIVKNNRKLILKSFLNN